MIVDFR